MPILEKIDHEKKRKVKRKTRKNPSNNGQKIIHKVNWKDVTPGDALSLLVDSGEGGFISLEEIDGDTCWEPELGVADDVYSGDMDADYSLEKPTKRRKVNTIREENGPFMESSIGISDNHFEVKDMKSSGKKKKISIRRKEVDIEQFLVTGSGGVPNSAEGTLVSGDGGSVQQVTDSLKLQESDDENAVDLSEWAELRLHPLLEKSLAALGFTEPTPIQRACIPAAAHQGKDIIGAAETGSGKTLAFGIPILQRLLSEQDKWSQATDELKYEGNTHKDLVVKDEFCHLRALIVTPTRELALQQICDHLRSVAKFTNIKVVSLVGGMSTQKQQRLLKGKPPIIVGTPGRLWELMSSGESHLHELQYLSFFVLDEADRMVEKGHFHELQSIIDMLPQSNKHVPELLSAGADDTLLNYDNMRDPETKYSTSIHNELRVPRKRRQTLVFSATLSLPPGFKKKLKTGVRLSQSVSGKAEYSVAYLSEKAGVSHKAAVIDLTSTAIVAAKLEESVLECREEEKDIYLYYILKVHGRGRTIVFCTSISALRRVSSILRFLQVSCWSLHAQMQQRQRLKAMDRFREKDDCVLVATDVAARGLDIPDIRTVVHYQLPHAAEMYVHRSGRTARALKDGCSIALISPSDKSKFSVLCSTLPKMKMLSKFPVNGTYLPAIQKRVALALQVDKASRRHSQLKAKESWFSLHAKELDLDFEDVKEENERENSNNANLKSLQRELHELLKQPLEPNAFSHRYITGAGITPLVATQLQDYASFRSNSHAGRSPMRGQKGRFVVIGQEQIEPLKALQNSLSLLKRPNTSSKIVNPKY
ncbi:hypothetical protein O6H91_05G073100 [Diphasiastrum complanatum]|uniref:Uncharacterized protein n=1 Tax=Diphasiastrum complanatum TaxID=34168 RepID=A0ACC2DPE7_DIPCM|nr:hypothetical protein O6H91_05G073100 [Diphasiastrum complanatum]